VITGTAPGREVIRRCLSLPLGDSIPPHPTGSILPGGVNNVTRGESVKRAVGFAFSYRNAAFAAGFDDYAEARVRLSLGPEGRPVAEVHSAAVECGQGLTTVLTQVARTELGVDVVLVHPPDSSSGDAGSSSASRQTFMSGGAVQSACRAIREGLLQRVQRQADVGSEVVEGPLTIEDGLILCNGMPVGPLDQYLAESIEATRRFHHAPTSRLDALGQGSPHVMFTFAAERVLVDVDEELGVVRVVEIAASQDVGRAINPQGVEGQVEGGTAQGLGFALMEEILVEEGRIRNPSFTDYLIPTILDVPAVKIALIEEEEPGMPYGAKGAGEASTVVAPAAIVAALRLATGRQLNRIPVRPDDLTGVSPPVSTPAIPPAPDVPGPLPILAYAREGSLGRPSG
jgi:CO/xanthine dehydrogenase Mo-binding subunit